MSKTEKLPDIRKEAFTKARESLGLSAKDLSGMSCFSVRQIEQIENGESSSFYGAQVKFTAAKKIADLLKLTPEEAFDFSGIVLAEKKQETKETKETTEKIKDKESTPAESVAESESNKSLRRVTESTLDYSVKSKAPVSPKKKIILLLAIAAAVIFSVVNLRPLFFPEPVKEEVVIIQELAPETPPASTPAEPANTPPAVAPVPATQPVAVTASAECPPADGSVVNYKPDAPKKAGDNVFLQSKTAQTVCVVDASGKIQNKTLEPGVGVSVYGKPPFKVLTSGLNQVDLYYQGAKVRTGSAGGKTIILESSELIQPSSSLNSSDSQLR